MAKKESPASTEQRVRALLARHGRTFAEEAGISLDKETPSDLYRLLCLALLLSAPLSGELAMRASKALSAEGWRTPQAMAQASFARRARVLNQAGYARLDERTSTMLGAGAELLISRWGGDLRALRNEAQGDRRRLGALLQQFKGIGAVGTAIFFREVQGLWPEVAPFVDRRAVAGARRLGLPTEAEKLAGLSQKKEFPRLVAALVRLDLAGDEDALDDDGAAGTAA